jgi:hypothetical protein
VLARDIVESLEAALEQFASIAEDLVEETGVDGQAAVQVGD